MTPSHFRTLVDDSAGPDACWPFGGYREPLGYGRVYTEDRLPNGKKRRIGAHKYSLELATGETYDADHHVLHTCDNPPCCNPAHLYVGTQSDNNRDIRERCRGRTEDRRGTRNPSARLTEDDVRALRALGDSYESLALRYGISAHQTYLIATRRRWPHVA